MNFQNRFNAKSFVLLSLILFVSICSYAQPHFPHGKKKGKKVRLVLNGYKGNIAVDNNDLFYPKENYKLNIDTGFHFINTGAAIGGFENTDFTSYIYFHVNKENDIDYLINTNSAKISDDKKKIALKTVDVTINPVECNLSYYISAFHKDFRVTTGKVTIKLVASQIYNIDNGAFVGYLDSASYSYFTVDKYGKIKSWNETAAKVNDKNELEFILKENKSFDPWKDGIVPESIEEIFYGVDRISLPKFKKPHHIKSINDLVNIVQWVDDQGVMQARYFKPY